MAQHLEREWLDQGRDDGGGKVDPGQITEPPTVEQQRPQVEQQVERDLGGDDQADRRQYGGVTECQAGEQQGDGGQAVYRLHGVERLDRQHARAKAAIARVADHVAIPELGL